MSIFWVYVLQSENTGRIYIGQTSNLTHRIAQHNNLKSSRTRFTYHQRGAWKLVYKEQYQNRKEAIRRERELKSAKGRAWLKSFLSSDTPR